MENLTFSISKELFGALPNYKVGGILIDSLESLDNKEYQIDDIVKNLLQIIQKRKLGFENSKSFLVWKEAFEKLNLNFKDINPSHIALFSRISKKNEFPRVNDLVDLYNIISLKYALPIGGHDVKDIRNISIGKTTGIEKFKSINSDEETSLPSDEFAYLDNDKKRVLTRNLVYRQADYTKITTNPKNIFIPIDDCNNIYSFETITLIAQELIGLLKLYFSFNYKFAISSKHNSIIDFSRIEQNNIEALRPTILLARSKVINDKDIVDKFFDRKLEQIYPSFDEFKKSLYSGQRLKFYMGADCTAPRLHIGHLIPFMKMAQLQKLGHQIIFLIGDFTGRIGDPTDKTAARTQLTPTEIMNNANEFKNQISNIIDFEDKDNPAIMVFNSQWNEQLTFQDVIELSTNFTVQQMLERDMFSNRMANQKPIFLHEFLYPLMQGYDSVYMEIDGEFGGMDQTFNMLAGRHMLKNMKSMEKFVITVPTLLSADGVNKMSKSIGQCIFLTDSSQDKYGKIMALPDNLIIHFYNLSTNLLDEEIKDIENKLNNATVDPMEAKKDLAYEIVKTLNGGEQANSAKNFFEKTIQEGQAPDDTPQVSKMELVSSITNKPIIKDLLIYLKLYTSSSEAKRQILAGAVEIDGKKVLDFNQAIDINSIEYIKAGKRNWIKLIN